MINQTLFSAIGREIHNNEYLNKYADIKLYNSGKIQFSDKKEKFSVIINNSEQAAKVLNKYGIENFGLKDWIGDRVDDLKSMPEKAMDKIAKGTGLGGKTVQRGKAKKLVAAKVANAAANMELQQKELKQAAKSIKKLSPTTASKIERLAKRGGDFKDSAKKFAGKLNKDTAVEVFKEYDKNEKELMKLDSERLDSITEKDNAHSDALKEVNRIEEELKSLRNKASRTKNPKEKEKMHDEIGELKDKLKKATKEAEKLKLTDEEKDELQEIADKHNIEVKIKSHDSEDDEEDFSICNKYTAMFRKNLKNFSK